MRRFLKTSLWFPAIIAITAQVQAQNQVANPYDQLISAARTLVQDQKQADAIQLCETAAHLDPNRWEAYQLEGSILALQKHYADAVPLLQKALERAPQDRKATLQQALNQARAAGAPPQTGAATSASPAPTQAEIVLWKTIENSNNMDDFRAYLRQYPNGTFAPLANSKLQNFEEQQRQAALHTEELNRQYELAKTQADEARKLALAKLPQISAAISSLVAKIGPQSRT